jgi:hypothetical protein
MQDIALGGEEVRRKQRLCLHTLSDTDDLPSSVSAETRYENCLPSEVTVFLSLLHQLDCC